MKGRRALYEWLEGVTRKPLYVGCFAAEWQRIEKHGTYGRRYEGKAHQATRRQAKDSRSRC